MASAAVLPTDRIRSAALKPIEAELITVVIPTFNRANLVREALDSIAAQTWQKVEIIVVDDGSTDHTDHVLETWRAAHPNCALRVLRQANRGPAAARNAGAAAARGEFLYFLDSDDLISPGALAMLAAPLLEGKKAPFSLAHIRNADLSGRPLQDDSEGVSRQVPGNYFASRWMTHAALYRRTTFAAVGPFDESLRRAEDTEHQWRVLASVGPGMLLNAYIGVRRIHPHGHLCIGRTAAEGARDDLAAVRLFLTWAERNGKKSIPICRTVFLRSAIAAIRAGHSRDWACHAESLSLLLRSSDRLPWAWQIIFGVLRLRSRLVHTPAALAIVTLKWVRDRLRTLRGCGNKQSGAALAQSRASNFPDAQGWEAWG